MDQNVLAAASFLNQKLNSSTKVALVLGSGLGVFTESVSVQQEIPYSEIPHFPMSTVEGHRGSLILAHVEKKPLVILSGRIHYYEGKTLQEVTFPMRVLKKMGIETVMLTNAAGILNPKFKPGMFMLLKDHINLIGENPLRGKNWEGWGPRFPNLSEAYDPTLRKLALKVANQEKFLLKEGVYVALPGPSYETPAEVNMYKKWGGYAVGMSTVPEVIVANHQGTKICAFSCLTNYAASASHKDVCHEEVLEMSKKVSKNFSRFLKKFILQLA